MEYDYTPRLIKKFINQIEINYKENLVNVDSNKNKETMFLASIIVSAMQIFNREDIKDNIIDIIDDFIISSDNQVANNSKEIINKYIENFSEKNIFIDRKLLKEYIKIIFYKEKIPNNEDFSNLISKYYEGKENIKNIITKINNYFSIFSSDILLKNLQDSILEIIDDKNIYYITNISKELNESLKKYKINFLESSQNLADKILQYNINKTNDNIFYIYVYFINKAKYKNEIKNILNNILSSKGKYKSNLLLDFIELINNFYKNNKNINIPDILNDYNFLIDIINNNYIYILFGYYYNFRSDDMTVEGYGALYYSINKLNIITKRVIFYILDKNNINNTIKVLLNGIDRDSFLEINDNTDINDVSIGNEDIWILLFNDLYVAKKIDKDNSYKLINKGLELISKEKQYILYFMAFDYFYRYKEFPIDDEKMKKLNPRNYVYIIIIAIYKFKDNNKYDNINKTLIKNIIYSFNEYIMDDFSINSYNLIDRIMNNIYDLSENKENDEYYQDLKKLKDDFENNINHS